MERPLAGWQPAVPYVKYLSAMKIFHGTENANILRPTVLTLCVFDGLHLGHQAIMKTMVERAKAINAVPTAITFDPHISLLLSKSTLSKYSRRIRFSFA